MIEIISSDTEPKHLEQLRWLFLSEWEKIDDFNSAITAMDNEEIVGGLVFTRYKIPGSEARGLWINALFIIPEYRRQGIASRLIKAAELEALNNNEINLYVYSNIPQLYLSCGWSLIDNQGEHKVLKRNIHH